MRYELTEAINGYRLDIVEDDFKTKRYNVGRLADVYQMIIKDVQSRLQDEMKKMGKAPFSMEVI